MALKDCPDARLVILGSLYEQGLWAEIERYITTHKLEDRIIYAGTSDNPPAYYAMADAFVHSAFFEGGQLSLLEALAANLPVVTTEIGFAKHFKGRKGFAAVPPPLEIIDYHGSIGELKSTAKCERAMAVEMANVYADPVRPDLPERIVEMFDMQHTYKLYISLIKERMESDHSDWHLPQSWPDLLKAHDNSTIKLLNA